MRYANVASVAKLGPQRKVLFCRLMRRTKAYTMSNAGVVWLPAFLGNWNNLGNIHRNPVNIGKQ